MNASELIRKYPIISDQIRSDELGVLLRELETVLKKSIEGDVVELGCYEGTSALFFKRLLNVYKSEKKLWLYDSFEGLPEKTHEDQAASGELFVGGALKASQARLKRNFTKAGLKIPEIKKAWFWELDPSDLPDKICFAFLDGDFYESILDSLKLVLPKMTAGGVIIVDDYANVKLPGARRAVDEFIADKELTIKTETSLAIISA
ncbi:class I SAM-dependent methyltransferase [Candidatus Saccharibacteria bacterium]|nr:class I SAM-dependent methyltransferase [Candidatus Saccharibacteria bacterium]